MTTQHQVVNDFIQSLKDIKFWKKQIYNDTGNVLEDIKGEILINNILIPSIENSIIIYEILEKSKEKNEFVKVFINNFNFNMNHYRDWISEMKEINKNLENCKLDLEMSTLEDI